jgi:hypothetical protein
MACKKSPAGRRGEGCVVITLSLFSAGQANRCRHQLGGREGLHLREDLEQFELLLLVDWLSQPTLERSVPAIGPPE